MVQDWRGTEIEIGSTVIYPGRHSSRLYMVEGIVNEIGEEPINNWGAKEIRPFLMVNPLMEKGTGRAKLRKDKLVKITRVDLVTVLQDD
jgi:hypothetical protein